MQKVTKGSFLLPFVAFSTVFNKKSRHFRCDEIIIKIVVIRFVYFQLLRFKVWTDVVIVMRWATFSNPTFFAILQAN